MQLNVFDRAIELIAPGAALRRGMARMQLGVLRKYEAAETGRRASGWKAGGGSANVEVFQGLALVRNRARQMVRDNEYAKSAIRTLATGIVGSTGINVIPENKTERATWAAWAENDCDADGQLDFPGLQRLAAHTWKQDGEVLVRRRWRRPQDGLAVPMQIQLLEPDHLDHLKTGIDGAFVNIMGVQYNAFGQRTGYWLHPQHPGELSLTGLHLQSVLVPASEVIHLYRKDRISQARGISEIAVSLMRLRDLKGYEEAELVRKKIEACFTAFVTTDQPRMTLGDLKKEEGTQPSRVTEKLSPGLIKYLTQGESVSFGSPQANGGYGEYTATQLHAIAAGAGVTFAQLTGDTSRSNYTSHRAGLRTYYDLIEAEQWLTFIPGFIRPVRRWWREAAQLAGLRVGTKPDRITTPRKAMVDPLKDTLADKEEIRAGLKSLSEALRERGMDPETVLAEIKTERDALALMQLVFDTDATVTSLKLNPADLLAGASGNAE
jgi:lambda family phage portal protein